MTQPFLPECVFCGENVAHEFTTPCCHQQAHTQCIEKIRSRTGTTGEPVVPCPFCRAEWKLSEKESPLDDDFVPVFLPPLSDGITSLHFRDHQVIYAALLTARNSMPYYFYADCEIEFLECLLDHSQYRRLTPSELRAVEDCQTRCRFGSLST